MHEHLSRELFRAIHKGWRNPGDLAAVAMAHLFELCPHCQREFETWRGEVGEGVAADEGDYDGVVQRVRERTAANDLDSDGEEARVERERQEVASRAEELLALSDEQRIDWIRKEREQHSGLLLAEVLIEECRRKTPGYPHEGYALADLARVVLQHAPVTSYAIELYALALARLANAIRVIGDLPRADQTLGDAQYLLRTKAGGDRGIQAEVYSLQGSLKTAQHRFDEAKSSLLRASMAYNLESNTTQVVAVLLKLVKAHNCDRESARSYELLRKIGELLRDEPNPYLNVVYRQAQATTFFGDGDHQAALRVIDQGHADRDSWNPLLELRSRWTVNKIAFEAGRLELAEAEFLALRNSFDEEGLRYDVAHLDFDLARIYVRQGRKEAALERLSSAHAGYEGVGATRAGGKLEAFRASAFAH